MSDVDNVSGESQLTKNCEICNRSFARSEHLARHRRIHTKEKPFTCPYCRRSFQRSDVKATHVRKCYAAPSNHSNDDGTRKRARIACDGCRRRKMRCDGNRPCAKCVATDSDCQYAGLMNLTASSVSLIDECHLDPVHATNQGDVGFTAPPSAHSALGDATWQDPALTDGAQLTDSLTAEAADMSILNPGRADVLPFGVPGSENVSCDFSANMSAFSGGPHDDFFQLFARDGTEDWQTTSLVICFKPTHIAESDIAQNIPFWFDEAEPTGNNAMLGGSLPSFENTIPSSMQNLTTEIQEYFDGKSDMPSLTTSTRWFASLPKLTDHNQDILRVFLNVFRRHIPRTFALFRNTAQTHAGRAAYTLAMAAVGGLFCNVSGSSEVTKSMYNDARKLLLGSQRRADDASSSLEDKLVTVKTFVLLALYGLCSGDKRSYEFTEAFQAHLLNSVNEYNEVYQTLDPDDQRQMEHARLQETLHIFDCYRVIIMQCPPCPAWHSNDSSTQLPSLSDRRSQRPAGGALVSATDSEESNLASLACVSSFLWPSIYPRQNRYGSNGIVVEDVCLWKGDLVEIACDAWLRCNDCATASDLAVYHMIHIMLHANLTVIQSFAHSAPESAARDPAKSLTAAEIRAWARSRHFTIAYWHADRILTGIEDAFTTSGNGPEHSGSQRVSALEPRRLPFEAPHVPYAVYFAALIIWCGAMAEEPAVSTSSANDAILRGERVLSLQRMHVAQLLARVLSEVR